MNDYIKSDLVVGLRGLYVNNDVAKRLFDNFATRKKDMRVTPVARAAYLADATQGEMVALFRALDELGAGEFKLGRRGSKTRIEWLYSQCSLGQVAQGAASHPESIDPTDFEEDDTELAEIEGTDSADGEWITHSFQLRADLRITLNLPADITTKEADRLAGFIRQVPFDE
jgi:hypothetical protein